MARARNIKPGFFKNEDLAECEPFARLCFAGLWTLADRDGRLEDRPKRIKGELFAFDSVEVEPLLAALAHHGFILRYQVDGRAVIQIVNFAKHQNPHHREAPSVLPAPPGWTKPEPQTGDASHDTEAPGEPQAGPGLAPGSSPVEGGASRADSLIPSSLIPDPLQSSADHPSDGPAADKPSTRRAAKAKEPGKTVATWQAYAEAYERRHGAKPLQNRTVNGQVGQFVDQVGAADAPLVAAFYVGCNDAFYVAAMHPINLLLRDASKLRTLWATGRTSSARPTSGQNYRQVASLWSGGNRAGAKNAAAAQAAFGSGQEMIDD